MFFKENSINMDSDSVNKYDYRYSNEYDDVSGSEDRLGDFVAVEPRDTPDINKIEYDPNNWKKNPYIFPVNDMNLLKSFRRHNFRKHIKRILIMNNQFS